MTSGPNGVARSRATLRKARRRGRCASNPGSTTRRESVPRPPRASRSRSLDSRVPSPVGGIRMVPSRASPSHRRSTSRRCPCRATAPASARRWPRDGSSCDRPSHRDRQRSVDPRSRGRPVRSRSHPRRARRQLRPTSRTVLRGTRPGARRRSRAVPARDCSFRGQSLGIEPQSQPVLEVERDTGQESGDQHQ